MPEKTGGGWGVPPDRKRSRKFRVLSLCRDVLEKSGRWFIDRGALLNRMGPQPSREPLPLTFIGPSPPFSTYRPCGVSVSVSRAEGRAGA